MDNHSLLHALKVSECRTPIDQMQGSSTIRICPNCQGHVYVSGDLDETQLAELIRSHHPTAGPQSIRMRRDGNVIVGERPPAWWGYQRIGVVYFAVYGLWVLLLVGSFLLRLLLPHAY